LKDELSVAISNGVMINVLQEVRRLPILPVSSIAVSHGLLFTARC